MERPIIVIVPGFNEPDKDMHTLAQGRRGKPGLEQRGFRCIEFPQYEGDLSYRIERYAEFVQTLAADPTSGGSVVSLGYSLGGLVVRGFLRRYPGLVHTVARTIQLGTPNWGITADMLPMLTSFLRLQDGGLRDLDIDSDFMRWLNGTGGHWEGGGKERNWVLDGEPWVAPPGATLYSIYGAVPHFGGDNDGIVWKDSATLGGRIPSGEIRSERANHLNLIGAWNPGTVLIKGFLFDDEVWPQAIALAAEAIVGSASGERETDAQRT
jgi:pimeloyl-ACP methyl ester carboxylesterase